MLRWLSLIFVISFSLVHHVSSETCSYGYYTYYCSLGQTCGSYYGDCRGLSAYAIMGIVFASITLLSICIRCCIYMNAPRPQRVPVTVTTTPTGRVVRVRVRPGATTPVRPIPAGGAFVHNVVEEAPPTYAAATASVGGEVKY